MSKEKKNNILKKTTNFKRLNISLLKSLLILLTVLPTIFWIISVNKNYKHRIEFAKLQKENTELNNKIAIDSAQQVRLLNEVMNLQKQIDEMNSKIIIYQRELINDRKTKQNITKSINYINLNLRKISAEVQKLKKNLNSNRAVNNSH